LICLYSFHSVKIAKSNFKREKEMGNHYVHNLNPVIFHLGMFQIRWYGLMYVIGFIIAGYFFKLLIKKKFFNVPIEQVDNLVTTLIICMFIGARSFYIFIYNWDYYSAHLTDIFAIWKGGLSFHGALAGLLGGGYLFAWRNKIPWSQVMDVVALGGTQGLFFGRIGNFINGELYGRITDSSFGIIFPDGGPFPRHPSQLYEGFLEGLILFLLLWLYLKKATRYGQVASVFLMGYGLFRFVIEFFREPDAQLGYYFGFMTMGQILCFIMIFIGALAYYLSIKQNNLISKEAMIR
jgi:phosphatidylglycerol:prolipoprotein diacylglycerol transferase